VTEGLVHLPSADTELALPERLIDAARHYLAEARSKRTREAYGRAWALFQSWCLANGRQALPASAETVAAWMTALADGDDGKPRARATINQYLSAVLVAQRAAGHSFDRKHPLIAGVWRGISNSKAKIEVERQARPILAEDLRAMLATLRPQIAAEARDAAILALGWSAALRRSELVGLDWQKLGEGDGYLLVDERGIVIMLARSKSAQAEAVTIVVPGTDMPAACEAVARWAEVARLEPGEPVFRPVDQRQIIGCTRLTDHSVSCIVKERVRLLARMRGKTVEEAAELVERFSGHSMRAGYATSAAAADMPGYRIKQHTRHKSDAMVSRYIREADKWTKSGLKGVGF
jgi:integrase